MGAVANKRRCRATVSEEPTREDTRGRGLAASEVLGAALVRHEIARIVCTAAKRSPRGWEALRGDAAKAKLAAR